MQQYQEDFITLALEKKALQFGQFTLKSGRASPYFFNMAKLSDAHSLATVGRCYAALLEKELPHVEMLVGPAYKGIGIAMSTALHVFWHAHQNVNVAFNRKEIKSHGEKGMWVGPVPEGNIILLDDVLSAGTAIRETLHLLKETSATVHTIAIALDRQERGQGTHTASEELQAELQVPIKAIVTLDDLIAYAGAELHSDTQQAMQAYRDQYGPA